MKWMYLLFLIAFAPIPAHSGDCPSHPMFIHEMEVRSCEMISEANAGRVSRGASPKVVAARYPGAILEGTRKAVRQIDLEEPLGDVKFAVHPWQKKDEKKTFLYRARDLGDCSAFWSGAQVKFASFTNCECDTGPAPDGRCALTVQEVTTIPAEHLKYAE
jgi:hypothetical protein